jgi:hypothetical protein
MPGVFTVSSNFLRERTLTEWLFADGRKRFRKNYQIAAATGWDL